MSNFEDGSYGSLAGIALIGKVLAGRCQMCYTRAAVGKGSIPDGKTPKTMDGPPEYVMDARIANVTNPVDGECQITIQVRSDDVETGFYITSIVLYAEDPDEGEIPYTYLCLENEPEWIRPASSIVGKFATFDLIAAVGDVDNVSVIIDPDAIATMGWVEQKVNDLRSITNTKNIEDAFYGTNENDDSETWTKVWSLVKMLTGNVDIENKGSLQEQLDSIFDTQDSVSVIDDDDKSITTTYADGTSTIIVMDDTSMIETEYDAEGGKVSRTGIYMEENRIEIRGLGLDER